MALQKSLPRQRMGTAQGAHLPPPVGGLNSRDPLPAMKPQFAVDLVNIFPSSEECRLRGGSAAHTTGGLGKPIHSLLPYNGPGNSGRLFAATGDGIYDVSAGGSVSGAVAAVTLDDGDVRGLNFQNSAGDAFLWVACPGRPVAVYTGAAWMLLDSTSVPAITNVDPTKLRNPWQFKRRIFCIEAGTLTAWYFEVDSIAGAAAAVPLGPLFSRGGELIAGGTWSLDGGSGMDDYCVFVTSEGEVAVYQGSNPDDSGDWALVGVYFVGKPMGTRCLFKLGADLGILTVGGVFPISTALKTADKSSSDALTGISSRLGSSTPRRLSAGLAGRPKCTRSRTRCW
jgi:hypothetical protein